MYGSRPITAEEHVLIMKTLSEDHIGFRKSPTVILILSIIASTGLRLGDTLQLKDYSKTDWEWSIFNPDEKLIRHKTIFPEEKKEAFEKGVQLAR